jgi:hypothetical protein
MKEFRVVMCSVSEESIRDSLLKTGLEIVKIEKRIDGMWDVSLKTRGVK